VASSISPRSAYLLTKLAAFALAALLTVPLARVVGPRAWWGLAAFGAVLAVLALVVVMTFGRKTTEADPPPETAAPLDPDGPVELPVEDALDLHPFAPRDIPDVVADYLGAAHAAGFREVRLIHGRGLGVQRERVRKVLTRHPLVVSFHDATPDRGGWGATIAYLSQGDR
jgi:hypothetical protein